MLIAEYEDTLKIMANLIMYGENDTIKHRANESFLSTLGDILQYEKSFEYPFDSLKTISIQTSTDHKIRIFTWFLKKSNGSHQFFGFVQYYNKPKKRIELISLVDHSEEIRRPEEILLDNTNWYGSLYYKIIYIKKNGRRYYTLLGWDGNDSFSTKKIIDVMYISGKGKIRFGAPIFKNDKTITNRYILEYNTSTSISVRYEENEKRIVFDHLVPIRKELEGLFEYYVPDGTYNAFIYNQGKWMLKNNVPVYNNETKSNPKKEKPKMGIIPPQ